MNMQGFRNQYKWWSEQESDALIVINQNKAYLIFVIHVFRGPLHSISWSDQRRPYDTNPAISIDENGFVL